MIVDDQSNILDAGDEELTSGRLRSLMNNLSRLKSKIGFNESTLKASNGFALLIPSKERLARGAASQEYYRIEDTTHHRQITSLEEHQRHKTTE